jgi:hypothetical protein
MEKSMENSDLSTGETVPGKGKGVFARIISVFTEPAELFPLLVKKTDWFVPFILIAIIGGTLSPGGYFIRPIAVRDMYPAMMQNIEKWKAQMGPEQFNEVKRKVDEGFKEALENKFHWYYILLDLILPFIFFAVIAAIGLVAGNFLFGGRAGFWTVMNVVVFAGLIGALGDAIRGVIILLKDTTYIYTGLGLIKPEDDGGFLFYLLRQIDLFSIWRIAVTAIGLGAIYKMKPIRFGYVLFGVWIIFITLIAAANLFTGGTIVY